MINHVISAGVSCVNTSWAGQTFHFIKAHLETKHLVLEQKHRLIVQKNTTKAERQPKKLQQHLGFWLGSPLLQAPHHILIPHRILNPPKTSGSMRKKLLSSVWWGFKSRVLLPAADSADDVRPLAGRSKWLNGARAPKSNRPGTCGW